MPLQLVCSKGILANLNVSKIFTVVPYPYVKFEEKQYGDVAELVRPTVLELCQNFV